MMRPAYSFAHDLFGKPVSTFPDPASIQHHAVLGQEHPLSRRVALQHQVPLPRRNLRRAAAVDADADFREIDRQIGALVGRPFEAALEFQPRHRPAAIVMRLDLHRRAAVRAALDTGVDPPVARVLIVRSRDLLLVAQARGIGAVDIGARQRADRKPHHDHINADHDAEKRDQYGQHLAPGQRFFRNGGLVHQGNSCAAHSATKLSVAEAASPSPISVTWNFTGIDFAGLSSAGAVTSTRSSAVWSRPITIIGRSGVTESTPTTWIVAFFGPSTSMAMTRSKPRLLRRRTV